MTPHHPHRCDSCSLVASVRLTKCWWDVYLCCGGRTLLFRWGEGGKYYAAPRADFPLPTNVSRDGRFGAINEVWRRVFGTKKPA